ncbi:LCCL domain-domain-containing protein [Tuber borchii]|uniref:LCCL domain-domain-containing protein n=1 Tax=Tuber borchii TaxID=42251 RepID=A0A2T6ZBB5_TUBBO|nr:LCCL domain-domain-containing protein [Tuber borchii]
MSPHSQSPPPSITVERTLTQSSTTSQLQPQDDAPETPLSPTATPPDPPFMVIWRWMRGPNPPKDVTFTPFFAKWQDLPLRLLYRGRLRRRKWQLALLLLFWFAWLTTFITVIHNSRFISKVNGQKPYFLSCSSVLWSKNNLCGIDGEYCRPFVNSTAPFRCPAGCLKTNVLNPRAVGEQIVAYQPLVIGGPSGNSSDGLLENAVYRSDSFICSAAIHSGLISNRYGGCGVFSLAGSQSYFPSSKRHGISSIMFDATFPSSFNFLSGVNTFRCHDLRWHLLAVSLLFTILSSLLITSIPVFFSSVFAGTFFHVALASDPPFSTNPYELVSISLSRFLPAAFCAFVIYKYAVTYTLSLSRDHTIEKTLLWLSGLWIGALNNITLDPIIPIYRLTGRDLRQQPHAITALVIVVLFLLVIVIFQAHFFRLTGRMPKYLLTYTGFGVGLSLLAAIPGSALRIHHYILALLLLPGTRLRNRMSLLYQGLLVGLFINGTARWGFAGIVETPESLRGRDGLYFSTIPRLAMPEIPPAGNNVTFFWEGMTTRGWEEGVSVVINDVERFRVSGVSGAATWNRTRTATGGWEKVYVRVGYWGTGAMGDYTAAGVVEEDGTWRAPGSGRT